MTENIKNIPVKLSCEKGCCHYNVMQYNHSYYSNHLDQIRTKIKKSGSFIYNSAQHKVLLVQSRGQMWGPPKGTLKDGEDTLDCCLREVKEETGLDLDPSLFCGSIIVKSKAYYYYTDMEEKDVVLQDKVVDNDANGIGWFNIDCVNDLVKSGRFSINQHCRILIKKIFGKDIVYNKE